MTFNHHWTNTDSANYITSFLNHHILCMVFCGVLFFTLLIESLSYIEKNEEYSPRNASALFDTHILYNLLGIFDTCVALISLKKIQGGLVYTTLHLGGVLLRSQGAVWAGEEEAFEIIE